jgi:hypothetical protein
MYRQKAASFLRAGAESNSLSFEFTSSSSMRFSFGNSAMISCELIAAKCRFFQSGQI